MDFDEWRDDYVKRTGYNLVRREGVPDFMRDAFKAGWAHGEGIGTKKAYEAGQRDVNEELLAVLKRAYPIVNEVYESGGTNAVTNVVVAIEQAIAKAEKLKP